MEYVYIMSNSSFPYDLLKIGWTRKHPIERANDLHTSGIPTPFIIENIILTYDGYALEKKIHNHIDSYRVNQKREFFKINPNILFSILTKELMLDLTPINEINNPIYNKTKYGKKIEELIYLYESLKNDSYRFFNKFDKENTELIISGNIHVSLQKTNINTTCFHIHGFECNIEDKDELYIKRAYYWITRELRQHELCLNNLLTNYESIKETIGIKTLNMDNKSFKEQIIETRIRLNNLTNKYIWDL